MDLVAITELFTVQTAILAAIGLGTMIAVAGMGRALSDKGPAAERMAPKNRFSAKGLGHGYGEIDNSSSAFANALVTSNEEERFAVSIALAKAGFRGAGAVAGFYTTRLLLALFIPALMMLLIAYSRTPGAVDVVASSVGSMSTMGLAQIICVLCAIGFFGPTFWLRGRIAERQQAITEAFPNALDLIQIGVEAGLGFDQAIMRVATEIQPVAPDLSDEILLAQNEIQAGRDREKA